MVLSGSFQGVTVLLLSDLGRPGQIKLAERYPDLRADIVVAGLPDQGEPLADGLLALIQPKLIIIADSHLPATARASKPLRERLARQQAPVVYTSDSGTITLRLRNKCWDINPSQPASAQIRDSPGIPTLTCLHPALLQNPARRGNGTYFTPKTFLPKRLRRGGCGTVSNNTWRLRRCISFRVF